jgi:eukaryotic-like serine/threonine-protein kinase
MNVMLSEGNVIADRYQLSRALAFGGMGAVWAAWDRGLRREVAVKLLNAAMMTSPQVRARFKREAQTAAQIRSAHVIQTYDYGIDRGVPYIVLELLEGEDLCTRLKRERRLSFAVVVRIFGQVLSALQAVHAAGIVHRDLKPANVFLVRGAEGEQVKLLDFGVARAAGLDAVSTTCPGMMLGTPRYMSPEQARGRTDVDARSDLWSVAVILYRALTGFHAFPGTSVEETLRRICRDPVESPSQLLLDLPPGTDAFFERALMRDRAARFQSAREMAAALAELAAMDPEDLSLAVTTRLRAPPLEPPPPDAAWDRMTPTTPFLLVNRKRSGQMRPPPLPPRPVVPRPVAQGRGDRRSSTLS